MRIQCLLFADAPHPIIPWTYPFDLTRWIYQVLDQRDPQLVTEWHRTTRATTIRPFSVSWLAFPEKPDTRANGLQLRNPFLTVTFGCYDDRLADALLHAPNDLPVMLGATRCHLAGTFPVPAPFLAADTLWNITSPLVVTIRESGRRRFLTPYDDRFWPLVRQNLAHKVSLFHHASVPDATTVMAAGKPRPKLLFINNHRVRGWLWSSPLRISGPPAVQDTVWTLGLGVYNSNGFGHAEPVLEFATP
jgi:CRISPR-associated endoribonuclease Cas6